VSITCVYYLLRQVGLDRELWSHRLLDTQRAALRRWEQHEDITICSLFVLSWILVGHALCLAMFLFLLIYFSLLSALLLFNNYWTQICAPVCFHYISPLLLALHSYRPSLASSLVPFVFEPKRQWLDLVVPALDLGLLHEGAVYPFEVRTRPIYLSIFCFFSSKVHHSS
jgi:hypothetical protein